MGRFEHPTAITANQPSQWYKGENGADLAIIAHADFLGSLGPLKTLREGQGWSVALIDVGDLYDEFSFGNKTPQALRDFLFRAKSYWQKPPRFVLLVGNAYFDPRNYLAAGGFDFVPTKFIETARMETASDDWFVDFNGDGLPEMAIGRLPVTTAEEAATVVSKITGYEHSTPMKEALIVADINDGYDFVTASLEVAALLPRDIAVKRIFRGSYGNDDVANEDLLNSMDQGPLLVNYMGHGSEETWRGDLLTSQDVGTLNNGLNLPFVVSMTCLNGLFYDIYTESLAEALLKAKQGGAIAVWASSGLTEPSGQATMNQEMIRLLFNGKSLSLGEAAMKAKAAVNDLDIRRTWILFGDPATRLHSK